eukprot:6176239-Pleurochrysis_carterae.AAC.4
MPVITPELDKAPAGAARLAQAPLPTHAPAFSPDLRAHAGASTRPHTDACIRTSSLTRLVRRACE